MKFEIGEAVLGEFYAPMATVYLDGKPFCGVVSGDFGETEEKARRIVAALKQQEITERLVEALKECLHIVEESHDYAPESHQPFLAAMAEKADQAIVAFGKLKGKGPQNEIDS